MADAPKPGTPPAKEPLKELPLQAAVQKFQGRAKRKPEDQAEYFYKGKILHIVMFASSLAMLVSFLLMFKKDYVRGWKEYQTEFAHMDFEKLWYDMGALQKETDARKAEIAGIEKEIADFVKGIRGRSLPADLFQKDLPPPDGAPKTLTVEVDEAKLALSIAEWKAISGEHYDKSLKFNFAKDEQGAARYVVEEARHHAEDARKTSDSRLKGIEEHLRHAEKAWETVLKKVAERKADFDQVDRKKTFYEDFAQKLKSAGVPGEASAKKPLEALVAEKARILKELEEKQLRFAKERPSFANTARNAPMSDFFSPTLKVRQEILPNLKDQLNFAKVEKVDRCHTCHVGIQNPDYSVDIIPDPQGDELKKQYVFRNEFLRKFIEHAQGRPDAKDCVVCDAAGRGKKEMKEPLTRHGAWSSSDAVRFTKAFMAHPRLDLYAAGSSKHPVDKFGCTICHEGDGRDTEFSRVVHTPDSYHEGQAWRTRHGTPYGEERYNWNYRELWDLPMIASKHLQASCRRCHDQEVELEGGERYTTAMKLFERAGCYGCHRTDSYQILPKDLNDAAIDVNRKSRRPGPPLTRIAAKVTEEWAAKWILEPRAFRATTRMPHFFGQSNTRNEVNKKPYPCKDVDGVRRSPVDDAIVQSMVKYLWSLPDDSEKDPEPPANVKGDARRGELLATQVGCAACHKFEPTTRESYGKHDSAFLREFGPNLSGIGTKFEGRGKGWLYAWVRNPKQHFKDSSMPSLRLTEQEAADVVEYLMTLKNDAFKAKAAPGPVDPQLLNDLIFEQLQKKMPDKFATEALEGKSPDPDYAELKTPEGKVLWFGRKMVANYGCYSCHELKPELAPLKPGVTLKPGEERPKVMDWPNLEGIGVELTGSQPFGSKHHDRLDFGFASYDGVNHHGVTFEHGFHGRVMEPSEGPNLRTKEIQVHETRQDWLKAKLLNPRVFDGGKMKSKPWDELLRMPNFGWSEWEAELISTFVLSFTDHKVAGLVDNAQRRLKPEEVALQRGNRVARDNNCAGCHRLALDTFDLDWERKEGKKTVRSRERVEGNRGPRQATSDVAAELKAWGLVGDKATPEELNRFAVHKVDWVVDHRTLVRPGAINPNSNLVVTDGLAWWYLDTDAAGKKVKRPIHLRRPMDGGDVIPQIQAYKRKLNVEYADAKKKLEERFSQVEDLLKSAQGARKSELEAEQKKLEELLDGEYSGDGVVDMLDLEIRYPPMLRTQGVKTHSDWLFRFLKRPYPIRGNIFPLGPGAKVLADVSIRMPTFEFMDEEAASLVKWFAARDHLPGRDFAQEANADPDPKLPREAVMSKLVTNPTGCASCHWIDGKAPTGPAISAQGPELTGVPERLRRRWIEAWMREPLAIYPGTKMVSLWTKLEDPTTEGAAQRLELNSVVEGMIHMKKGNSPK